MFSNFFRPFIDLFTNPNFVMVLGYLYKSAFIWLPIILIVVGVDLWINYARSRYIAKQKYVLLEVRLPKEIYKSPRAAEFFISGMFKKDFERNWYEKYYLGQTRQDFSLEIASIDGGVHFFIRTRAAQRPIIEANIYSQYPGIEIYEVEDYTLPFSFDPEKQGLIAFEFDLVKPDVYPIKTYVDYGMDKDPKEEFKIDPLTPLIEFMSSLGKGHQAWFQIILRAHVSGVNVKDPVTKQSYVADKKLEDAAQDEIKRIQDSAKGEKDKDGKIIPGTGRFLNDVETETIKALARSASKNAFDVGMRIIYTAPKDIYVAGNIGGMVGGITHLNSNNLNGFKPARGSSDIRPFFNNTFGFNVPRSDKVRNEERQNMVDAYKRRAYFYAPYKRPHFVLNSEELATLFHFPGSVSAAPTLGRIGSKKSEAPSNLPQ
jgi:hypothetical protein